MPSWVVYIFRPFISEEVSEEEGFWGVHPLATKSRMRLKRRRRFLIEGMVYVFGAMNLK